MQVLNTTCSTTPVQTYKSRFPWVYCQFVIVRRCLLGRIRRPFCELSKTLDKAYERILQDIDEANLGICLLSAPVIAVASRPLRVELASYLHARALSAIVKVN